MLITDSPIDSLLLSVAMVTSVKVDEQAGSTVKVSWNAVTLPCIKITSYKVYYHPTGSSKQGHDESFLVVPGSDTTVVITGLSGDVEYQFQVVALVGNAEGLRSMVNVNSTRKIILKGK